MTAIRTLARTVDLVRSDVYPQANEDDVVAALTGVRMRLVGGEDDLSSDAGQTALVTAAIVAAQSGAELLLDLADVPLLPAQPPLSGERLTDALLALTRELITPGREHDDGPADLTIAIGTAPAPSDALRLAPTLNGVELAHHSGRNAIGWSVGHQLAALFGGIAAGAEAFKVAMRQLRSAGHVPLPGNATRELRPVRLDVEATTGADLGQVDVISAGAISQGMLFALLRLPGVAAQLRIFDHDCLDWPNLNRYPLGSASMLEEPKAELLKRYATSAIGIQSVNEKFDDALAERVTLAPLVAVGVDDIPSRWRAQRFAPGTVVVGGTSHFEVVVSEHPPGEPCAGCLYLDDDEPPADVAPPAIPTVSFVSTFAGVLQAQRLLTVGGQTSARQTRAAPLNLAGADPLVELGASYRRPCPAGC
jgi:hypothetical protein